MVAGREAVLRMFQLIRHVVTEPTVGGTLAARLAVGAVTLVWAAARRPPEAVFTPARALVPWR